MSLIRKPLQPDNKPSLLLKKLRIVPPNKVRDDEFVDLDESERDCVQRRFEHRNIELFYF